MNAEVRDWMRRRDEQRRAAGQPVGIHRTVEQIARWWRGEPLLVDALDWPAPVGELSGNSGQFADATAAASAIVPIDEPAEPRGIAAVVASLLRHAEALGKPSRHLLHADGFFEQEVIPQDIRALVGALAAKDAEIGQLQKQLAFKAAMLDLLHPNHEFRRMEGAEMIRLVGMTETLSARVATAEAERDAAVSELATHWTAEPDAAEREIERLRQVERNNGTLRMQLAEVEAERDRLRELHAKISADGFQCCEEFKQSQAADLEGLRGESSRLRQGIACAIRAETAAVVDGALVYNSRQTTRLIDLAARIESGEVPRPEDWGLVAAPIAAGSPPRPRPWRALLWGWL